MRQVAQIYRFGDFTLATSEHLLRKLDRDVFLRPKAFGTLLYLVERHGHLVTKDELVDRVWAGTSVTDAVITHCVAEVRQALGDSPRKPRFLQTIPRVGYKFIGNVEAAVPDDGHPVRERPPGSDAAIAVLPFVNLSADPENEYFCDGLSEQLIHALTRFGHLRVVAHSSAFTFKGRDTDVREIGIKLNVESVLEGSVRKAGTRLRVAAQLIDARNGYHLWSEQYDRHLDDIFAIQDEISSAILKRLTIAPPTGGMPRLASHHTCDLEAYNLYLKGRSFWHRRYEGFLQKAMECFQDAIDRDPLYALAYVGLADCYSSLGLWALAPPLEVFRRATALTDKALAIDDCLAEAHASRALLDTFCTWDWTAAERGFRRAIDLNPGYAIVHLWYGHLLSIVGRMDDSLVEVRRAQILDPLSPTVNANVGYTLFLARQYEAAESELAKTLELDPHYATAHFYLGALYGRRGKYEEAIEEQKKALTMTGGALLWAAGSTGYAYAMAGDRRRAHTVLRGLCEHRGYIPPSVRACVYVGLGEDAKVYECLSQALKERDSLMPWIKVLPIFDRLRADARFQDLLHRMGLS
jgi:TolB-like protein/Tfp pilus assembly protein PilF